MGMNNKLRDFDSYDRRGEIIHGIPEDYAEFKDYIFDNSNEDVRKIYNFIRKKKVTFPSEIATGLFMETKRVSSILYQLEERGHIITIHPSYYQNDTRLLRRRAELWLRGIKGMERFKQMHWVADAHIKQKFE